MAVEGSFMLTLAATYTVRFVEGRGVEVSAEAGSIYVRDGGAD